MKMASSQYLRGANKLQSLLIVVGIVLIVATVISLWLNIVAVQEARLQLAESRARSLFQTLVAARSWNASHGGVYVPIRDGIVPNPYLEDPLRDLEATNGMRLTMINPAYMTRLISEDLTKASKISTHITSLKPLRPQNQASSWEERALHSFEDGVSEYRELTLDNGEATFRYMAPLMTTKICLQCHAKQGYKVGDVRGGISVAFDYAPFARSVRSSIHRLYLVHGFFGVGFLALITVLGRRLIRETRNLESSTVRVQRLESLLPICSNCKKINLDQGDKEHDQWVPVEQYLKQQLEAEMTHGICPACLAKYYSDPASD